MGFSLTAVFGVDGTGVRTEIRQLRREFNSFIQDYAKLGAGLAVGAFIALSKGALDLASNLKDAALQIGVNVESLQALHFAATQNGSSIESMNKALTKLRLGVRSAFEGNQELNAAFTTLGLSAKELIKLPLEQQYARIGQAYRSAADKGAAYNAVCKIFSEKVGPDQIKVLEQLGTDGFPKVARAAAAAGQVLKAETIVALEAASQAIEDFKKRATVAVGNILVNFRTEEGTKLVGLQLMRAAGTFGARIIDALSEANQFIGAVLTGTAVAVANRFRDAFIDGIANIAEKINLILPDSLAIDVNGIEALKSAGLTVAETIENAIASTKPLNFTKDVEAFWGRAVDDQKKVVDQLNRIDLGKPAAELRNAGKDIQRGGIAAAEKIDESAQKFIDAGHTVGEALASGAVTFAAANDLWNASIDRAISASKEMGGLLAGIRGGSTFNNLSEEALSEVVRQNRTAANRLRNPALNPNAGGIGSNLDAARLEAEALNAQSQLDVINRFRQSLSVQGVEGARRQYDPVLFETLLRQFGPGSQDIQNRVANGIDELNRKIDRGLVVKPIGG